MNPEIESFNRAQDPVSRKICEILATEVQAGLDKAEGKIWHGHPVWFIDGNPIVGYNKLKDCVRLLFWSGQSFVGAGLAPSGSFKAAEVRFTSEAQIDVQALRGWLGEAGTIQWDYKNIVKRKGRLERLS